MCRNLVAIGRQFGGLGGRNLQGLRTAAELYVMLDPTDTECRLLVARLNLHLGINHEQVCFILHTYMNRMSLTIS